MIPQERILKSSMELFAQYGIRSVTMDDICKHLAMSKKTIYKYFKDKDELVFQLMNDEVKKNEKEFCCIKEDSKDAVDEIILMIEHIIKVFSNMNPTLFYDLQKYYPEAWNQFKKFKDQHILEMVETNLVAGIEQGIYRKGLDVKIIARMRISLVELAFNPQIFPPSQFLLTQVHVQLLEHFLYGIVTLKGHKLVNNYKQLQEEE